MATKRLKTGDEYMMEALTDAETARNKVYRSQTNKDIEEAKKESEEASARVRRMSKGYVNTGAGRGQVNPPTINSREQYLHEKEQGDPYANSLSFEEWKKL